MKSNTSFENYTKSHGMQVQNYHAEEGGFANNTFTNDAKNQNHQISYCGGNADQQNGKAEKRIMEHFCLCKILEITKHQLHITKLSITRSCYPIADSIENTL